MVQFGLSAFLTIPVYYYQRPLQWTSSQEIKEKQLNVVYLLQVFFIFAIFVFRYIIKKKIFVFRETRFFRNLGSFAKLRNSSLIFMKHENCFVASFAKFSRSKFRQKLYRGARHGMSIKCFGYESGDQVRPSAEENYRRCKIL